MKRLTDVERYNRLVEEYNGHLEKQMTSGQLDRLCRKIYEFYPKFIGRTFRVPAQPKNGIKHETYMKVTGIRNMDGKTVKSFDDMTLYCCRLAGDLVFKVDSYDVNDKFKGDLSNFPLLEEIDEAEWKKQLSNVAARAVIDVLYRTIGSMAHHIKWEAWNEYSKKKPVAPITNRIVALQAQINALQDKKAALERKFAEDWKKKNGKKFLREKLGAVLEQDKFPDKVAAKLREIAGTLK